MTVALERRYRSLLRVYPGGFIIRYGDELLDTLMERSRPGQRWPSIPEALGLMRSAAAVRLGVTGRRGTGQTWVSALHLSVVFLLGWVLIDPVGDVIHPEWGHLRGGLISLTLGALALVAVTRGWLVPALGLVAGWLVLAERREVVRGELLLAMAVLLLLSTALRGRYGRLHPAWLLVVPPLVLDNLVFRYTYTAGWGGVDLFGARLFDGLYVPSVVALGVLAVALAVDPRLGLVGAILALGGVLTYGVEVPLPHNGFQPFLTVDWQVGVCAALAVALGATGHRLARRLDRA